MGRPPTAVLVVVGVCALLLAAVLGYVTLRDTVGADEGSRPAALDTRRVVSERGGFSVDAPTEMTAKKQGGGIRLASADHSLVVTLGKGPRGPLSRANSRFLADMSKEYRRFKLLASDPQTVDGRMALSTSGQATNSAGVRIRFVAMMVRARPRNYVMVAFAAFDADPAEVLPRVNAVANGFEVLR
jgi:hypothetical protein